MTTNLKLAFNGVSGNKVSFNFPFADSSASATQVKNLMQLIVANGDIYSEIPQSPSKAEFVVNTVTPIDIS